MLLSNDGYKISLSYNPSISADNKTSLARKAKNRNERVLNAEQMFLVAKDLHYLHKQHKSSFVVSKIFLSPFSGLQNKALSIFKHNVLLLPLSSVFAFYQAYGLMAVILGPFRTGYLLMSLYLCMKASYVNK